MNAVLYARSSQLGPNLEQQLQLLREWAEPEYSVVGIYLDTAEVPGEQQLSLENLLELLKSGEVDTTLVRGLDRIAMNTSEVAALVEFLQLIGVDISFARIVSDRDLGN